MTTASYPVSQDGLPFVEVGGSGDTPITDTVLNNIADGASFLGQGLLWPFQRDAKSDFANGAGSDLVKAAIIAVLGTRAATPDGRAQGELPWRGDFGSLLYLLRHRSLDATTRELARVYVAQAIQRWEPRARIKAVELTGKTQDGGQALVIRVRYDLIARNVPGNQVILSGLEVSVPVE